MAMARFQFGDIIENGYAGEGNPRKRGIYLWSFNRPGRLNPGPHVKLLHDDGRTGELRISADDKMTKVGTIFDVKDAEIAMLREAIKPAYLGLLVLKTMCRKAGLQGGVEATESAMKNLVSAVPELPALSALRVPAPENPGDTNA